MHSHSKFLIAFAIAAVGCSGSRNPTDSDPDPSRDSYIVVGTSAELTAALERSKADDTVVVRGGTYHAPPTGWQFANGGVTVTNYPGQVAKLYANSAKSGNYIFKCLQTSPPADGVRINGTNVGAGKGIVLFGDQLGIAPAIVAYHCDGWEISGIEFRDVAYAIFQRKVNNGKISADRWFVHDNLVDNYFRESGMQFNGNENIISNNTITKKGGYSSTFGCQLLNILGNRNVVKGNSLSRLDQTVRCIGIFFEWDLADSNVVEGNSITGVVNGMSFYGGDGNLIRGNTLSGTDTAFVIRSWVNGTTAYPCNFSDFMPLESDTSNPDWSFMYPHDCRSRSNRFEGNVVTGFSGLASVVVPEPSNVFVWPVRDAASHVRE